eukprot:scaffold93924_cov30-Prasinocladus_malaysianus.AAC.1
MHVGRGAQRIRLVVLPDGQRPAEPDPRRLHLSQGGARDLPQPPLNEPEMPELLKGKVIHLGPNNVASLDRVPALVLDYNADIDIENDVEAQKEYVKQVMAYKEYLMQCRSAKNSLWMPQQTPLYPEAGSEQMIYLNK